MPKETHPEKEHSSDWMLELARKIKGIQESEQRILKLVTILNERNPEEVADFFQFLVKKTVEKVPEFSRLHLDLIQHKDHLKRFSYEKTAEMYRYARENEWPEVVALLRSPELTDDEFEQLPEGFAKRLESLTLGERRQLSRGLDRKDLEVLLFDSNPMVVKELLQNPRIVERDVVRMASRHRAPMEVLEEICRSKKWIRNYHVKKALVFNPRTPLAYAIGFVQHLDQKDLALLAGGSSVRNELIEVARQNVKKTKD